MDYKFLKIDEKENGVIVLTISREKTLNSLNTEVLKELSDFFEKIFDDEATSVIVLTGAGKSFLPAPTLVKWQLFLLQKAMILEN